jgi:hypothetical protein
MTENTPSTGTDPATLRNVPEGLLDTRAEAAVPPAAARTPPYADTVGDPASADGPPIDGPPVADVPYVPTWSADAEPTLPPTTAAEQASFAPAGAGEGGARSLLRRWAAPAALVAAGLLGGMAATTAITNAGAATTTGIEQPGSGQAPRGGDSLSDDSGISVEQLSPEADRDGEGFDADGDGHGPGHHDGGYSLSDGFSLRDNAPTTQGTTAASG